MNITGGDFTGAQIAGLVNYANGSGRGAQIAGMVNMTGEDFTGAQIGLVNLGGGSMSGLQLGLVNISGGDSGYVQKIGLVNITNNEDEIPIGLVNIVKNGMLHPVLWYDNMNFANAGLKSGSKRFYTLLSAGTQKISMGKEYDLGGNRDDASIMVYRVGFGVELPLGPCFLNIDALAGQMYDTDFPAARRDVSDADNKYDASASAIFQLRASVGWKLYEHLGAFAGVSYDYIQRHSNTSPVPASRGVFDLPWGNSKQIHRLGLFAGLQF